jgi:hypothetical protein
MKRFAAFAFSMALISCAADLPDTSEFAGVDNKGNIGLLTFNSPTTMWWWYPSPEKPQPVGQCTIPAGKWGVNFRTWKVDGYYLVRFTTTVPGCEGHQSGFISAESDMIHPDSLFVPMTAKETLDRLPEHDSGVKERLMPFYVEAANYQKVKTRVVDWFGSTINGCVMFTSTALRMTGTNIPSTKQIGGDVVTLTTKPFVRHMLDNLKWKKVEDVREFQPGDIGVTVDHPNFPTYPSHVYIFVRWKDKAKGIAIVNDNQGYMKDRAVFGSASDDKTAFAVRPPQ